MCYATIKIFPFYSCNWSESIDILNTQISLTLKKSMFPMLEILEIIIADSCSAHQDKSIGI